MSDLAFVLGAASLVLTSGGAFSLGWNLCSRTQSNRVDDAQKIARVSRSASETLLKAAHTERAAADALVIAARDIAANTTELKRAQQVLDTLDSNVGAVLSALVNMGAMTHVTPGMGRQVGEPDRERMPPPLEGKSALDSIVR